MKIGGEVTHGELKVSFHENVGKSFQVFSSFGMRELIKCGKCLFSVAVDECSCFFKDSASFINFFHFSNLVGTGAFIDDD